MNNRSNDYPEEIRLKKRRRRTRAGIHLTPLGLLLLLACNLLALGVIAYPLRNSFRNLLPTQLLPSPTQPSQTPTELPSPPPIPTDTHVPPTATPTVTATPMNDLLILAMEEVGYSHLFAYQPELVPFIRLTNGSWDDITPAISPNQQQMAFASNRSGFWDLYLLDLTNGETTRLTDTTQYDASPSWSPDGQYIAYETYTNDNLDIAIISISGEIAPIVFNQPQSADYSPAWSPRGRQIAFVSNLSGESEIWLADLDKAGAERFSNLSQNSLAVEGHPAWSPDGSALVWAAIEEGQHKLYLQKNGDQARYLGNGDLPVWSQTGDKILTLLSTPNQSWLTAYQAENALLVLPARLLPGTVRGLSWGSATLPKPLPADLAQAARLTPTSAWQPEQTQQENIPTGRQYLVPLLDVQAPYPQLHDQVDEAFQALRKHVAQSTGWDLLSTLENAFLPLTAPLPPSLGADWLYTGRAFAITPLPINAGWMVVVREQYDAQIYWRVYLRARFQDGSQGIPLQDYPWDFTARFLQDHSDYEQGGALSNIIPAGYWVDFTRLAAAYGWERLPALPSWRSYYPAARFNEFVMKIGLDWQTAMLQIYPPEALITPTLPLSPTHTPTPTPRGYRTPTPTFTPTKPPTLTPLPPSPTPTQGG